MDHRQTIRWGILGCGDVARRRVADAIRSHPGSKLLAACRRNAAALHEFCDQFQVERAYEREQDLIADPDIDAVYVATPVDLHLPQTLAAAAAGKHVLVEKPMAMSVGQCRQMIDGCRQYNVKLGVAYYRRFYPVVDRIKQLLADGAIGNPLSVSVLTATAMAMVPGEDGYWRAIPQRGGGGALMDIGSHRIDLLLDIFGDVSHVKCICGTVAADYQAEDCASLILQFPSGLQGTLQCLFGPPLDPDEFSITGTRGRIRCAPLNDGHLTVWRSGEELRETHAPATNFNLPLIDDFVASIRENCQPRVSGEEGLATNEVMHRAYDSARQLGRES